MPELFVVAGIVITLLMSLHPEGKKHVPAVTSIVLGLAAFYTLFLLLPAVSQRLLFSSEGLPVAPLNIFANSYISDTLSVFFRALIYPVSFVISLGCGKYLKPLESPAEYYPIMLTATLGAAFLTGANDFLLFFVALETLGLSSILLAAYARLSQKSNEAGLKYLLTSATATGLLLLGISMIYGLTGATNFTAVHQRLTSLGDGLSFGLEALIATLFVASVAFKLGAAPFHNWSPDVYTGAPTSTTAFLSVVSKAGALALAIRLFGVVLTPDIFFKTIAPSNISLLLAIAAVLSIVIGNFVGVVQMISRGSIKRMLAYSSIAQAGYLLIGLVVTQADSIESMVIYFAIYAIMNTGAFMAAIYAESELNSDNIYDYSGLINKRPITTLAFSLCLLNLAGLPFIPAAFIAKFFLFATAYSSGLWLGQVLAIIGLIGSVVALFYYSYLAKIMIVDTPSNAVKSLSDDETCCGSKILSALFGSWVSTTIHTVVLIISIVCAILANNLWVPLYTLAFLVLFYWLNLDAEKQASKWAHLGVMLPVIALVYFGLFKMSALSSLVALVINGVGN